MSLMTINEVASYLGLQSGRVERLEREHLLLAKDKGPDGKPLFSKQDVENYKKFADRIGGV